jgi:hypothetical protein
VTTPACQVQFVLMKWGHRAIVGSDRLSTVSWDSPGSVQRSFFGKTLLFSQLRRFPSQALAVTLT